MELNYIFWVAMAAYSFHILEEYSYDWKSWAQKILKLDVDWNTFYVANAAVLFLGIACASVGWSHPTFSLIFPSLMIVNAVGFHIVPYVRSKRKFSPGMFTAIFLFLPISVGCFKMAINMGVYPKSLLIAAGCGILPRLSPSFCSKPKISIFLSHSRTSVLTLLFSVHLSLRTGILLYYVSFIFVTTPASFAYKARLV
jgi:hypothetical protein